MRCFYQARKPKAVMLLCTVYVDRSFAGGEKQDRVSKNNVPEISRDERPGGVTVALGFPTVTRGGLNRE